MYKVKKAMQVGGRLFSFRARARVADAGKSARDGAQEWRRAP